MKQKTISHTAVLRFICDNLDASGDSERCRTIRRHLDSCPECCKQLAALKHTVLLYQNLPEPNMPASAKKRLRALLKGLG